MRKIIPSTILLIGVACFGVGISNVAQYINDRTPDIWYGQYPMPFSTSVVVLFIGLALFLTGEKFRYYDKKAL